MSVEQEELRRAPVDYLSNPSPRPPARLRPWVVAGSAAGAVAAVLALNTLVTSAGDQSDTAPGAAGASSPVTAPTTGPAAPEGERFPVTLQAPGWTCDPPADEKFVCQWGGAAVLVTVRPASSHDAYLRDPDKAAPGQYVSDVHHGVFATLVGISGEVETDTAALGRSLVWE